MIKRKKYTLCNGDVIDVHEFHDGKYGAPGKKRQKKKKPTKEQMQAVNKSNKERKCRQKMLEYFKAGDWLFTLTYQVRYRPVSMAVALEHFRKFRRKVHRAYQKRGYELFWIRNIERGTKGAWHIHLIVNAIDDTLKIVNDAWKFGYTNPIEIGVSDKYDEDFTQLANYLTKDENTRELKKDGTPAKPKIKEANYNTSRNMPLPDPDVEKLYRWKKEPKAKKGYWIAKSHEGNNPYNNCKYRRYTMVRLGSEKHREIEEVMRLWDSG